jgi:hypothetical protein
MRHTDVHRNGAPRWMKGSPNLALAMQKQRERPGLWPYLNISLSLLTGETGGCRSAFTLI